MASVTTFPVRVRTIYGRLWIGELMSAFVFALFVVRVVHLRPYFFYMLAMMRSNGCKFAPILY